MKRLILTTLLACACSLSIASDQINESAPLKKGGLLMITNVSGDVIVQGWSKNEVEVTGTLGKEAERLVFDADGDEILVKVEQRKDKDKEKDKDWNNWRHEGGGTTLSIRAPHSANLKIKTVSADVTIKDIRGSQRIRTVSGDLHTTVDSEDAELRTVSGDLLVEGKGKRGDFALYTVSGEIEAGGLAGEISAESVSGDIDLSAGDVKEARLKTVSGDIEGALGMEKDGELQMDSVSGDIEMSLPKNFAADYELSSFSGDIREIFGVQANRKSKYSPGSELMYHHNKGKGRVRANTMSGDVDLMMTL